MNEVKMKRDVLLEKVRTNRTEHITVLEKAKAGYRSAAIDKLKARLKDAIDGGPISLRIDLNAPEDHTRDYDRVITMLEMSVDETVTLDAHSFDQYVLDQWQWKAGFDLTASSYGHR